MFLGLDATILARIQFAFTVTFHIIFPAFTIGLASYIATLEAIWFFRDDDRYHRLARFWTKVFAVSFAMGVVSGLPMSYQFGTNWSKFSVTAGNVIGPLLGYEVLTAFFLEASFLGIMLFGWNRVPKGLHFFASLMVAFGTLLSAFWILSANSWMQYPTGFEIKDGVAIPVDWLQVIFNPTFPYRLAHMVTAAYLTTSIVVLAIGARYWLANTYHEEARIMIRMGLGLAIVLAPLQLFIGDQHGLATAEYQPAKLAAMEGHWDGSKPGELVLFGIPDEAAQRNDYEIGIPHLGKPHHLPSLERAFQGFGRVQAGGQAPRVGSVFRLPNHGRDRALADPARAHRRHPLVARQAFRKPPLHAGGLAFLAAGLHRGHRGMGHNRGRPAALGRNRAHAHRSGRFAR